MKHEFKDEVRIKVTHDHNVDPEAAAEVISKIVDGAVTIIAVATLSHFLKRIL